MWRNCSIFHANLPHIPNRRWNQSAMPARFRAEPLATTKKVKRLLNQSIISIHLQLLLLLHFSVNKIFHKLHACHKPLSRYLDRIQSIFSSRLRHLQRRHTPNSDSHLQPHMHCTPETYVASIVRFHRNYNSCAASRKRYMSTAWQEPFTWFEFRSTFCIRAEFVIVCGGRVCVCAAWYCGCR